MRHRNKGFTIFEALVVIILVSMASVFFASVFTSAYKTTARSRKDTQKVFEGQTKVEEEIVSAINEASDFAAGISGANPPDQGVLVWGRKVDGYGVRVEVGDRAVQNTFKANILSFVFAGEKKPRIPVLTFERLNASDPKLPKFMYIEDYFSRLDDQYIYRYSITDTELIQRILQREYFGSRSKEVDGRKYISRPFTDFKDEQTRNTAPVYSSYFSGGYSSVDKKGSSLFDKDTPIPRTLSKQPHHSKVSLPDFSSSRDPRKEKEDFKNNHRDSGYVKTLQVQTVSGYATSEEVIPDAITWFVGTPVLNGLVGQWDANLLFNQELTDDIVSYKDNAFLGSEWKSVNELARNNKQLEVAISGSALLRVREEGTNSYRRFSNGVALPVDSGSDNRINLQFQNGKNLDRSKGGAGRMGEGSYSILIRAKQNIAGSDSALFTVNMNNIGSIINTTNRTNEANGFYLVSNGNRIQYKYDAGTHVTDPTRRFVDMTSLADLQASTYNANLADAQDERADYRIYELQITNAGRSDLFNFRLLVDNKQVAFQAPISNHYSDLSKFGLDLGANLEISDILVYDRVLSADESKTMAEYLLNKYIIS